MLFNSLEFLVFFPVVSLLYYLVPFKYRWLLLLGASYYFYMSWRPEYIILILLSTVIDYLVAKKIDKAWNQRRKTIYLGVSLTLNLGLLFVFKYYNFFIDAVGMTLNQLKIGYRPIYLEVLLPVGISFYTFQTLSYTLDVYQGKRKPENHFGLFALFVSFYPQLVAGPIERSERLIQQLKQKVTFDYEQVTYGLKRMVWGFFKKVVIADRLAVMVDYVYQSPETFSGITLLIATVFFSLQIYCDFSAYSDIAIGCAKVLGIDLMENFRRPYLAKSVQEFWRRWHISLSIWFRDYVFIPLGGSRVKRKKYLRNIIIIFLLSGLWHGANWTFVMWGALHGVYSVIEVFLRPVREKIEKRVASSWTRSLYSIYRTILTFTLVNVAWVFFRANTLEDGFYILKKIVATFSLEIGELFQVLTHLGLSPNDLYIVLGAIGFLGIIDLIDERLGLMPTLSKQRAYIRWLVYYVVTTATIWLAYTGASQFVYFQF